MLAKLHIENVAIIESADLSLSGGFNVLTGETGAGKSILIDSINMVLGERVSRDIVRTGAGRAHVSALFTGIAPAAAAQIEELGFAPDEDGSLLFQRDLSADGKSACHISGRIATAALLRQAGRLLVNTHGQHDNQALLSPERHIGYLDSYAELAGELAAYREAYGALQRLSREVSSISTDESERARRMDLLAYQVDEIEKAQLSPGEDEELHARRTASLNHEKIVQALAEACAALSGGDEVQAGGVAQLAQASDSLSGIADVYPEVGELAGQLTDLRYQAEELLSDLSALSEDREASSGEDLEALEQRLDLIYRLKKKYGSTIEEILAFCEKSRAELETLSGADERLEKLTAACEKARVRAAQLAAGLSKKRREAAAGLEKLIKRELSFLDMPAVEFRVRFEPRDLCPDGADRVEFLISANPGSQPRPLAKIASGGELSRIMLAIKNVLADKDDIETSIFDEIDTGVSGRAAHKIGLKLHEVSKGRQVVCVTHLAQIAAQADRHVLIEKSVEGGVTRTSLKTLDFEGRRQELARIIGGADITELTLKNAQEMLINAGVNPAAPQSAF